MPDIILPKQEDFSAAFDRPPEQVERGYVELAKFPDSPALKQADAAFDYVTTSLATDNEFRITRNPRDTLASHASKLSRQVEQSSVERARRIDAAKAAIKTERQQVEAQLQKAANLKANDKYANAVIGTFGAMRADQRATELEQLIERQEGPTLAVLVDAPIVTTGLTVEQRDSIKTRLYEKVAPGSLALLQHFDKVLRRIEAASLPRIDAELKLLVGTTAFDGKVKAAEAVAAKAQAGLLHSVSPNRRAGLNAGAAALLLKGLAMPSSDFDSGVVPWTPPADQQRQDREERRLIYNQFSTAELKRIEPKAFEPSATLLCLQLIETRRGAEFYRSAYNLARLDQREVRLSLQYSINAHDRAADIVERRLKRALKSLGYDAGAESNIQMLKLAEAGKLGQLSAYILDNSPMVKQVLSEDRNAR